MANFMLTGSYSDDKGNRIIVNENTKIDNVKVLLRGTNNTVIISEDVDVLSNFRIDLPSDNAVCIIGSIPKAVNQMRGHIRVGYNCFISIGNGVTCTKPLYITAAEQVQVLIGDDCMFATDNQLRAEDSHAIYDVMTGIRLNRSKDIIVGAHTWVSYAAKIFAGTSISDGSIVGLNSIVKGTFPNNCTIAGSPAKIVRRNVAWERPNVLRKKPWIREQAPQLEITEKYWRVTDEENYKPYLGEGFIQNLQLLKKYCPNSIWLESYENLLL